eukprot:CAMPEP_0181534570 /NCGR_PEP_ID=MMETSP1110-20121109/73810_1 /TAXON_ID=174948 /ORGANISM="Symbiodinium sp., Strain CCMP421" /LENGTH=135 /DNA_ID=CAMNT_0023665927 /DNA_START=767 /DNA_END=1171 /DNA_ORIENTATION=+
MAWAKAGPRPMSRATSPDRGARGAASGAKGAGRPMGLLRGPMPMGLGPMGGMAIWPRPPMGPMGPMGLMGPIMGPGLGLKPNGKPGPRLTPGPGGTFCQGASDEEETCDGLKLSKQLLPHSGHCSSRSGCTCAVT